MVNNMLEAARSESQSQWHWEVVRLGHVAEDAIEIIRPTVSGHPVRMQVDVQPPDLSINGDADALRRLLLNLLSNACRHTRQGSVEVRIRACTHSSRPSVIVSVRDTGDGISPAASRKMGIAFSDEDQTAILPMATSGAGLGLAICNQIAAAHGGSISARSAPGRGTIFTVMLRATLSHPQEAQETQPIRFEASA
jgi:signal transduction histidine kinase